MVRGDGKGSRCGHRLRASLVAIVAVQGLDGPQHGLQVPLDTGRGSQVPQERARQDEDPKV